MPRLDDDADLSDGEVLAELQKAVEKVETARRDLGSRLADLAGSAARDASLVRTVPPETLMLSCYADTTSVRAAEQRLEEARAELTDWARVRNLRRLNVPSIDDEFARLEPFIGRGRVTADGRELLVIRIEKVPMVGVRVTLTDPAVRNRDDTTCWSQDVLTPIGSSL
jgi:hypothetical protein